MVKFADFCDQMVLLLLVLLLLVLLLLVLLLIITIHVLQRPRSTILLSAFLSETRPEEIVADLPRDQKSPIPHR